ncbi:MAG: nuclear transport factor 2 family protein [Actinomycetota bacterium]|nr:nuclear transport factor 2 family protein [Actinomycetota bacterium]
MVEPRDLVGRWNELWVADRGALVAELYHPDVEVVSLRGEHPPIVGHDALSAALEPVGRRIAFPTAVATGVVVAGSSVSVEQRLGGREIDDPGPMAAPALRWWTLDDEGMITHELVWSDWSARRSTIPDDMAPTVPPAADGDQLSRAWYDSFVGRLAETWAWEPELSVRSFFADDCLLDAPGSAADAIVGADALVAVVDAQAERLVPRRRELRPLRVAGERSAVATAFVVEATDRELGGRRAAAGALVGALDASQRLRTARIYFDWSTARDPAELRDVLEVPAAG